MNITDILSESQPPKNNPVAKHARSFNKSSVQQDRKKASKKGYVKHKGKDVQTEAPVGALKQIGRKIGAKAAGAVGAKGTAAGLSGKAETGDTARQLAVDLKGYAGKTGLNPKQLDAQDLAAFLQSKKFPTTPLSGVSGVLTPKQVDQALLKSAQEKAKAGGSTAGSGVGAKTKSKTKTKTKSSQVGSGVIGKMQQQSGRPGPKTQGSASAGIPADLQAQLDELTPTEKKVLAGLL